MPKKVLCALPDSLLEQVDYVARVEHRTRSDLIREALRRYLDNFKRDQPNYKTSPAYGASASGVPIHE